MVGGIAASADDDVVDTDYVAVVVMKVVVAWELEAA